ncbi:ApbA-domain-containing protein [Coemansia reversa NRRL 1564]|uniref:2-dehydropantoate 2-reductase n=1 Tax=Coemansia reversa (strain ATCC 12441 / NRRL 1564) TaxID=763665 RepID=A0A2G5BE71_COERN|nr:ApbA-domain-containing protein [Coemansia reversa NRRL 1564]|eukprot:PIA17304.1 ApbA-domain-containing protein [Coemansia reversa NRRL 1564]
MSSDATIKVLLLGAGALGSIFAWRLQEGDKAKVTVVCRSNYSIVKSRGFSIVSEAYGKHTYHPNKVVRSVEDAVSDGTVYDFIIVCTKALPNLSDDSEMIVPAVNGNKTTIILIQNGIGIEKAFCVRFPESPIVSAVAYIDVSQPSDGVIEHGSNAMLLMGLCASENANYDTAAVNKSLQSVSGIWNDNGATCTIVENIQRFRWLKLVWNASFNTVSVVSGGNDTRQMLADPYCKGLIRNLMTEVYKIGEAATGEPLPVLLGADSPDAFIASTEANKTPVCPSMLMDFRARRPMEHEVILKRPLDVAKRLGIHAPYMEAVYALVVMVEKGYLSSRL